MSSEWTTPSWVDDHIKLYQTDPEKARLWTPPSGASPVPTLLLTTIGAKTGQKRLLPLIYGEANGAYLIVASRGGTPSHPAWYNNLVANPECEVQVGAKHFRARARTANAAQRPALWAAMRVVWPAYDDYQAKTQREIPVVVLEPLSN